MIRVRVVGQRTNLLEDGLYIPHIVDKVGQNDDVKSPIDVQILDVGFDEAQGRVTTFSGFERLG